MGLIKLTTLKTLFSINLQKKELMKKYFLLFAFVLPLCAIAQQPQSSGIHFEHGINWQQALDLAKKEKKNIFVDCFTTWCGPCKYMSNVVFTNPKTGAYFNEHFINLKLQLDTTANDNEEVKSWYATGHQFIRTYGISYYPTFLFFNADGKVVHRIVGGADADKFIAKATRATVPEKQYYTLLGRYQQGERNEELLYNLVLSSLDAYDLENADSIANEYFNAQKNLYTKENMDLLQNVTVNSGSRGFHIMLDNPQEVDAFLGKATSASITRDIIVQEDVAPYFDNALMNGILPDWNLLYTKLHNKYDDRAGELLDYSRMLFFKQNGNTDSMLSCISKYMNNYIDYLKPDIINAISWTVLQQQSDSTSLTEAAKWCENILAIQNPMFIDTYANLLYKAGQKDAAIEWEQKAVALGDDKSAPALQENLDKMKRGEKTWQD